MRIYKEPIQKYQYVFDYHFSLEILNFCRIIKLHYNQRDFHFVYKKWRFNNLEIIKLIKEQYPQVIIDANMYEDMEKYKRKQNLILEQIKKAKEIKSKLNTDLKIKNIKGELYPYQKIGVEFMINSGGKTMLIDQPGLGKSLQALAYVAHHEMKKVLVICPASVKFVWEDEVVKWTDYDPLIINGKTSLLPSTILQHQIIIINYDILKKFHATLQNIPWDCVIIDEFHYLKNSAALRSKYTKSIAKNIPSILLLSGTPLLNRPVELFNGLQLVDPDSWKDWIFFTKRYCAGHQTYFGWDCSGASNIEELKTKMDRYFIRRTKQNVLHDLPPKRYIYLPTTIDDESAANYKLAENSFIQYLREVKKKNISPTSKEVRAMKLVKLNELRQIASNGKIESAKEVIQNIIDGGEKIVVFSSYNKPLETLKGYFGAKAVMLTGQTEEDERKQAVRSFQDDEKVNIFLGGIKSAGVGITLTASSNVLFLDYSWVPADHLQSMDRCHRIGSKGDKVTIYQMYSKDTIDEYMRDILEKKQEIISQILNDTTGTIDSDLSLFSDIEKKYEQLAT